MWRAKGQGWAHEQHSLWKLEWEPLARSLGLHTVHTVLQRSDTQDCDSGRVSDAEEDELLILQGSVERAGKERKGPTPEDIYNNPWNSEDSPF